MHKLKSKLQKEANKAWKLNNYIGIVKACTGFGKTKLICDAIKAHYHKLTKYDKPIVIGVPTASLRDIGIPSEFRKWKMELPVEIVCYKTLAKWRKESIGLFIGDEFDTALTEKTLEFFKWNNCKMFLGTTATLDEDKIVLAEQIAPIVYDLPLRKAQEIGLINKTKILLHLVPLKENNDVYRKIQSEIVELDNTIMKSKHSNLDHFGRRAWLTHNMGNSGNRVNLLRNDSSLMDYAIDLKRKILHKNDNAKVILFSELTKYLDELSPNTYYGQKPQFDIELFNTNLVREVAVTPKKVGRGISFVGLNNSIGHTFTSSQSGFIQSLQGRMTRLDPNDVAWIHILVSTYRSKGQNHFCQNFWWFHNIVTSLKEKGDISPIRLYDQFKVTDKLTPFFTSKLNNIL